MLVWRYRRLSHVADTVRPAREPILDRLMNEVITEAKRMARRVFERVDAFNVSVVKVREEEREGWTSLGLMLLSFKASKLASCRQVPTATLHLYLHHSRSIVVVQHVCISQPSHESSSTANVSSSIICQST